MSRLCVIGIGIIDVIVSVRKIKRRGKLNVVRFVGRPRVAGVAPVAFASAPSSLASCFAV